MRGHRVLLVLLDPGLDVEEVESACSILFEAVGLPPVCSSTRPGLSRETLCPLDDCMIAYAASARPAEEWALSVDLFLRL